ncbi:MAG: hypothetical protein HC841_01725 [Verrucomicrobiae bacterium]|nr:hypothetical protein [Verrucomicrobiae bacterium]
MNTSSSTDSAGGPATSIGARVPFIVGVTGNMDPVGYDDDSAACRESQEVKDLRAELYDLLDWMTGLGSAKAVRQLNPETRRLWNDDCQPEDTEQRYHSCWKPLNLAASGTPLVILSSLAPGVDTLMAEAALDYAKERQADVTVRCPLPFPIHLYEQASTFNTPAKQQRLRELLARIKSQKHFDKRHDLFEVQLDNDLLPRDNDLLPQDATAKDDLTADDPKFGKPRRHLRYRAAGEYVATQSNLLIAIYDVEHDGKSNLDDLFESGASTVVEAKRRGLTHELLAVSNNFAWADNGPVLQVPIHRKKGTPAPAPTPPT